jgi:hypothetical protein
MKQLRLSAICWSLLFSAVIAAPPVPMITTNLQEGGEIVPGDLVVFDASTSTDADLFKWDVDPKRFPDGKPTNELSADGKSIRIASRPGTYSVLLAVANKEEIVLMRRIVNVGKSNPSPFNPQPFNPDPPKPDPAKPTFPDEQFGMSTLAYGAAIAMPDRSKHKSLAMAFRVVGGAAVAGGYNSLKEIELASVEANRKAICGTVDPNGEEGKAIRTAYLPFFKALQPKITELSLDKASLPAQYGRMLIEISDGLMAAGK